MCIRDLPDVKALGPWAYISGKFPMPIYNHYMYTILTLKILFCKPICGIHYYVTTYCMVQLKLNLTFTCMSH